MPTTIAELQKRLKNFDAAARKDATPASIKSAWNNLFETKISHESANSFTNYYREMRSSNTMKHRGGSRRQYGGGALEPAPLSYETTPGMNVAVYGRFPIEAGMDPASIRNLDVYFRDSLTADCGKAATPASFPTPPTEMGSNKVMSGGSRRKHRKSVKRGRASRKGLAFASRRKTMHRKRRTGRMRGGNLMESLGMRIPPFLASNPPGYAQAAANSVAGLPPAINGSPVTPAWGYQSNGIAGIVNPGEVTSITRSLGSLASPAPWQTSS